MYLDYSRSVQLIRELLPEVALVNTTEASGTHQETGP